MPRAIRFSQMLVLDAPPVKLADVVVPGIYQIGGDTAAFVWSTYNPPDRSGNSPENPAGQVQVMYLPKGCQVFAATSTGSMDTNASLWLVWPDES